MDTKQAPPVAAPERTRNRTGWLVAAGAFAIMLVVVGASLLFTTDGETPATTPPTTAVVTPTTEAAPATTVAGDPERPESVLTEEARQGAVAALLVNASTGDIDGLRSLLDGADVRMRLHRGGLSQSTGLESAEGVLALEHAMGTRFEIRECTFGEAETRIECGVDATEAVRDALGLGGLEMLLKADFNESGDVTWLFWEWDISANLYVDTGDWAADLAPFIAWLDESHPGDSQVMIPGGGRFSEPSSSPESIALWDERVGEYLALAESDAPTAEQLAVIASYTGAINRADVQAVAALLAPGFGHTDAANPGWMSGNDLWARQQAYWVAEGATVSHTECQPRADVVTCLETWSGPVQDAVFSRDWTYQMDFDVQDGLIASMHGYALVWPDQASEQAVRDRVAAWAETLDPELGAQLQDCGGGSAGEGFRMDLAGLCGEYTVAWVEAGRP